MLVLARDRDDQLQLGLGERPAVDHDRLAVDREAAVPAGRLEARIKGDDGAAAVGATRRLSRARVAAAVSGCVGPHGECREVVAAARVQETEERLAGTPLLHALERPIVATLIRDTRRQQHDGRQCTRGLKVW